MNNYIVFLGKSYYPNGGVWDKHKIFADFELAQKFALKSKNKWDWIHIFDIKKDKIIDIKNHRILT